MATKVAGELYESITGQLFEIGRQLRQTNGYPFDPEDLRNHLRAAVEGNFILTRDKRTGLLRKITPLPVCCPPQVSTVPLKQKALT